MLQEPLTLAAAAKVNARGQELLDQRILDSNIHIDRLFAWLLIAEWVGCILTALLLSPRTWSGSFSTVHLHLYAALFLGGLIALGPCLLVRFAPGATITRHCVAVAQMLMSGLLIHLGDGRIETHFIVFGSLAFLAFYRDWRVIVTATVVTGLDHVLRGAFLPQSIYGVLHVEPWRTVEHVWWVVFEDAFLVPSCIRGMREMKSLSYKQAEMEFHQNNVELEVTEKTAILRQTTDELQLAIVAAQNHADEQEVMLKHLADARDAAENSTRAKSAFLANMSHELRTPMNAILGYSELLMEDCVTTEQESLKADLARIHGAGKHLLQLINEILDLSKIEAGKLDIRPELFDVGGFINEVRDTVAPLTRARDNRFRIDLSSAPSSCYGDAQRIRQILINLLSNAFKFTDQGEVSLEIQMQEHGGHAWLTFSVADTGLGIDPEDASRLFADFVQASNKNAQGRGGTGLGLALSQRLARLLGGEITLQSTPGEGSNFTLWLPQDAVGCIAVPTQDVSQAIELMASQIAVTEHTRRALVIEDDPAAAELLRRHLAHAGWSVRIATSGADGLAMAEEWHPHAITLDVYMPVSDGWSTLQQLKANPELAAIPVVMISMSDEREKGLALGAAEFLAKPITGLKLGETLARLTDKWSERSILIVDDDEPTRELLARQLIEGGWKVRTAPDGKSALEELEARPCECLILDLMMPGLDGFEVLRRFRQTPSGVNTPVLVLTNRHLAPNEEEWLTDQHASVMQKAATPRTELLAALRGLTTAKHDPASVSEGSPV